MASRNLALFLALSLLCNAFSLPFEVYRQRRAVSDSGDSKTVSSSDKIKQAAQDIEESIATSTTSTTAVAIEKNKSLADDDDDDDDEFNDHSSSTGSNSGGSNIFSLLNLANAFFPASTSTNGATGLNHKLIQKQMKKIIQETWARNQMKKMQNDQRKIIHKRGDIADNVIDIDYTVDLKPPPFQRQESDEEDNSVASESSESEEDEGGEESVEELDENEDTNSKQDSASNASNGDDDNDSDYDEPEGDGQGGGILGLLAGLSGDGDSDLGTLLATVGGIVANLSGDGIDVNALIATALGLFVGLLSDGTQNPGEIIASYLLTSLDTITGGGAKNNGAFFGKFLSKLIKGTSAAGEPGEDGSEENGAPQMADSAGFIASLLLGLLGDMSKSSSNSGSWR